MLDGNVRLLSATRTMQWSKPRMRIERELSNKSEVRVFLKNLSIQNPILIIIQN